MIGMLRRFRQETDGNVTVFSLFMILVVGMIGAIAVDVSFLTAARTHLQTAADQAGHAALYNRSTKSADAAIAEAIAIAEGTLPASINGSVLTAADIEFGVWDGETRTFVADPNSISAVHVVTSMRNEKDNAAKSILFRLVGLEEFDVVAEAIFSTYRPPCLREGFIAEGVVDIQSNNGFSNGFCVHSNAYVSLNNNNTFEAGTIVSMPDLADLDLPSSGFDKNEGLEAALRSSRMYIRVLSRIDDIIDGLRGTGAGGAQYIPSYITNTVPVVLNDSRFNTADFAPGRIYELACRGNKATVDASVVLREVVLVSNCQIVISGDSKFEDVVIATTNTSASSITGSSGIKFGRRDNCAAGGGVQVVTMGGMRFPAAIEVSGAQLIAKDDISFAANADGLQGASFVAGGVIDGTSNMDMSRCGSGMEDNFEVDYYRMSL